jgi:protein required for attachment to host cells
MDKINVKAGEWVVVCDGRKALILENIGGQAFPNLHTKEIRETRKGEHARRVAMRRAACINRSALSAATSSRMIGTTRKSGHS